ncbi:ATP-grasp domain-containing protein [Amycolatopsis minnesotensis]|uniref:ATP-grasp domain-containing protein n=1 Tax=Amycolatopsis minnesotensis TaxID=337894 RepID=A0ABN2RK88_9PSEU
MTIAMLEALTFGMGLLADAADELGHELILLTRDRSVYRYELPGEPRIRVIDVDTFDVDAVLAALKPVHDLAGVVVNTDTWTETGAQVCHRLGLPGRTTGFAGRIRDKATVRETLIKVGLSNSQCFRLTREEVALGRDPREIRYPCVLKDVRGTGSAGAFLVRSAEDLDRLRTRIAGGGPERYVLESLHRGPLYSAETITYGGRTHLLGVTNRTVSDEPWVREEGISFPVRFDSPWERRVGEWISRVHAAVGVEDGLCHNEFIATSGGFEVVEINPRLAGAQVGRAITEAFGRNVYRTVLEFGIGRKPGWLAERRELRCGYAQSLRYAPAVGTIADITMDDLSTFPGDVQWWPTKYAGDRIDTTENQSASVGVLTARGETADEALDRVLAAGRTVRTWMV